jgi:DNA-binding PadR family transcriptional regulator
MVERSPYRKRVDVLHVETGSLYPAPHRSERRGWVRSEWKQTESDQIEEPVGDEA